MSDSVSNFRPTDIDRYRHVWTRDGREGSVLTTVEQSGKRISFSVVFGDVVFNYDWETGHESRGVTELDIVAVTNVTEIKPKRSRGYI